MTLNGWLQIAVYVLLILAVTKPLGIFMARVFAGERTFLTPVLAPVERGFYWLAGVDEKREQHWTTYSFALLLFSVVSFLAVYALQRLQGVIPYFNPQAMAAVSEHLAFNTAVSFMTNTTWQSYGGESTLGYLVQMAALTVQNFVSAAAGIAIAIALTRSFARSSATTIGNFWVDLTRATLYVLLPMSIVVAQVPVASQLAIKQLGTNGGGFFNANSAHPFENPTAITNLIEMWSILAISAALTYTFGRMVRSQRQGWTLFAAMAALFLAGLVVVYAAESAGNPTLAKLGLDAHTSELQAGGNMEGKEVRFGIANSSIWAVATTDASNGSVNSMHDSYTPLGGLVPLFNIELGEIIFGGVGAGLYGILLFAVLAVFIAGLMVGRTPEYLGKKIESKEVKMTILAILVIPLSILGFTALACLWPSAAGSLNNAGAHGFSEYLYAFTSGTGNNGSAFAGLNANTPFFDTTIGLSMLIGRFLLIVPLLGLAGSLVTKKIVPASAGTFPTTGPLWVGLLLGVILIEGGLVYFPALALGPLVEHFQMLA